MSRRRRPCPARARLGFAAALAALALAGPAHARDDDRPRAYVHIRWGSSLPLTSARDAGGISIGADLSRHLGLEFAMDDWDLNLEVPREGEVGELAMRSLMPQIRLRRSFVDGRLVTYVIGGIGMIVTQVNDTATPVTWRGGLTDVRFAGAVGGGLEYFLTDDIALGTEGKYVVAGHGRFAAAGERETISLDTPLWTFGLRFFHPERDPGAAERARHRRGTIYLALYTGGAALTTDRITPDVSADPEQAILGSPFTVLFGVAGGVNAGRHAGIELALDNREVRLNHGTRKGIGEYTLIPILLQLRLRYPLLGGRLEPYVLGGLGIELAELNDTPDSIRDLQPSGRDQTFVAAAGAGLEYFLSSDISVGWQLRYLFSRHHEFEIAGRPPATADLDTIFLTIHVRAHLLSL